MTTETKTEFAKRLGVHKSHITRLGEAGRLVLVGEGRAAKVDVEASLALLAQTEGNRDDVKDRHETAKGKDTTKPSESRVLAQTREQAAKADMAEMERDKMRGALIEREQVDQALADLVAFARQGVENLPHRVAAQLVGKDFEQIMAILREAVIETMSEMHREAGKRLAELTKMEG